MSPPRHGTHPLPAFGRWLPAEVVNIYHPQPLSAWLCDSGSLTARLVGHSRGQFQVQVLRQQWGRARADEALALGIDPRARVLIREVLLQGCGEAWVWARSILPYQFLQGSRRRLAGLDNRPLGAWLFRQPSLRRGPLQVACFDGAYAGRHGRSAGVGGGSGVDDGAPLWGRRSVFYVENQPVLVAELFLPAFAQSLRSR